MSFPTYFELRESGVEWLGQVPCEWKVAPVKHLAEFVNGEAFKPGEWSSEGVPIIRIQNLNGADSFNFFKGEVDQRYHVEFGDLLFGWSGNRGTSFGPFIWKRKGLHYLNQHIFKVNPKGVNPDWLYWCLQAVTEYIEQQAHGIIGMVHVTSGKLSSIPVPNIDDASQAAIATFLDRETVKIDALVAEQERLIALLKEKRQAVISHAVTKGLNPDAPMKDSGIEWLSEIPAHWQVLPIKAVATYNDEVLGEATDPALEIDYIEISDVDEAAGVKAAATLTFATAPSRARRLVRAGDILVSTVRTYLRAIAPVPHALDGAVASTGFCVIRGGSANSAYLGYALRSAAFVSEVIARSVGVSYPAINASDLVAIPVTLPSNIEQAAIAAFLDRETAKIDALVAEAQAAITLLRERRAALISAAVTGKIDVRGLIDLQKLEAA